MINYLLILAVSFGSFCNKLPTKLQTAKDYILSDLNTSKQKKIRLSVHEDQIPFSLQLVSESVISQDYIEGYSWFKKYGQDTIAVANAVMDSLKAKEIELNHSKYKNDFKASKLSQIAKSDFTIFYSHVSKGLLFAMVTESKYAQSGYLDVQGKGLLYCFKFDEEDKIKKVYTGEVHNQ